MDVSFVFTRKGTLWSNCLLSCFLLLDKQISKSPKTLRLILRGQEPEADGNISTNISLRHLRLYGIKPDLRSLNLTMYIIQNYIHFCLSACYSERQCGFNSIFFFCHFIHLFSIFWKSLGTGVSWFTFFYLLHKLQPAWQYSTSTCPKRHMHTCMKPKQILSQGLNSTNNPTITPVRMHAQSSASI